MSPNPELMHKYGTDEHYLRKCGQLPPDLAKLKALAPLAFMAYAAKDSADLERQQQEAEVLNMMFRAAEAQRMSGVNRGFKGASAGQVKTAERIGRALAHRVMEKHALATNPSISMSPTMIGGRANQAAVEGLSAGTRKMLRHAITPEMRAAGMTEAAAAQLMGAGRKAGENLGQAVRRQSGFSSGIARKGVKTMYQAPTLQGTEKAYSALGKDIASKGNILTGGRMLKGLGVLGAAGLVYGGYKALKGARNFMMKPTPERRENSYGVAPAHSVNQYGVPVYQ